MDPSLLPNRFASARTRFLDSLDTAKAEFADHDGFVTYWQTVEKEANQSEDLGQLDRWVKDLKRDRDRVQMLIERKQAAASDDMQAAQLVAILQRILAILDDLYGKIRKRHHELHDRVAWWLLLAPAGKKSKPLPKGLGDGPVKDKKDTKKEETVKAQNMAKKKEAPKPTKKKAP